MPVKYEPYEAMTWITPKRRGFKMRCCDCRLVHVMDFRIRKGRAQFRCARDNRATAASRKRNSEGKFGG